MAAPEILQALPQQQETPVFAPDNQNDDPRSLAPQQDIFLLRQFDTAGGAVESTDSRPRPFRLDLGKFPDLQERLATLPTTEEQFAAYGLTKASAQEARETQQLAGGFFIVFGTGPGSMGESTVLELVARGGNVLAITRSESGAQVVEKAREMVEKDGRGGSVRWLSQDITELHDGPKKKVVKEKTETEPAVTEEDPFQVDNFLAAAIKIGQEMNGDGAQPRLDGVSILTGSREDTSMGAAPTESMQRLMETNFFSHWRVIEATNSYMRRQLKRSQLPGRMGVMASLAHKAAPMQGGYGPAKAAEVNAVASLALEQKRRDDKAQTHTPIYINAHAPGLVDTGFVGKLTDEMREAVLADTEAERENTAQELGVFVAHMMTPDAGTTNGQPLEIVGRGEVIDFGLPVEPAPLFQPAA